MSLTGPVNGWRLDQSRLCAAVAAFGGNHIQVIGIADGKKSPVVINPPTPEQAL